MSHKGIDYGHGTSNIDTATGIRFGVISLNSLDPWVTDDFEADYGDPHCPKCGDAVIDTSEMDSDHEHAHDKDFFCENCTVTHWSDACFPDEAIGQHIDEEDFKAFIDSSNDVWFTKSHFYTHAQFCSPCAPGACHLDHPMPDGERAYCPGHDWFEGGVAPYPVYDVKTGQLVTPEEVA